ncbi:MAG: ABC transporter permease [Vicingaceae bacterium]
MLQYTIGRSIYGLLVLLGVISLIFFLFHIVPGDPARMMLGQMGDQKAMEAIKKDIGADLPIGLQYIKYLNDLSPLSIHEEIQEDQFLYLEKNTYDYHTLSRFNSKVLVLKWPYLRRSYQSQKKVVNILAEALPATLVLTAAAIGFAFLIGVFLGIVAALNQNSFVDRSLLVIATIGMSGPSFFIAILISWFFGFVLADYTGLNMTGSLMEIDDYGRGSYIDISNLILPAITLGIRPLSVVMQLMRNSLLDVMDQDYIRSARAKGLSEWAVIGRHAIRNSLNPVITAASGWFAGMLAGAVFVEMIFAWKGIGWTIFRALEQYDLPVVMGSVIVISSIFVLINILVDILYTFLDPRVKLQN